jgi:hypothetical protein
MTTLNKLVLLLGFVVLACHIEKSSSVYLFDTKNLHPPPQKPSVFRSKGELLAYLNKLNQYYAVAGRPRFGKRSWSPASVDDLDNAADLAENVNSDDNNSEYDDEYFMRLIPSNYARQQQQQTNRNQMSNYAADNNGNSHRLRLLNKLLREASRSD